MPRAPKPCGHYGCPTRVVGRTYCPAHQAEHEAKQAARRGTTAKRGYGSRHQTLRARWEPKVATGTVRCWRCGELITPGTPWDLGHDDHDRTKYKGPEHAGPCNRATAGRQRPTPPGTTPPPTSPP